MLSIHGDPVPCRSFYRDLFGPGFLQVPYRVDPDARRDGRPVSIANVVHESPRTGRLYRRNEYVTDGFRELERLDGHVAYVAPCSFLGGAKDLKHLRFIHALVVDLDYVGPTQLGELEHQVNIGHVPRPTYTVNSGTGLHLYYVFDEPQAAWPDKRPGYVALKRALINLAWNMYTSTSPDKQYSGLVQPYRVVGSRTKLDCDKDGRVVSREWDVFAWKTGVKWSLDELLDFEPNDTVLTDQWAGEIAKARKVFRPDLDPERLTLARAKEAYPDWYERRIVMGEPPATPGERKWHVNRRVYDWWLRRIRDEARVGHRYFCLMMLAVYAVKCDVPFKTLKRDAMSLYHKFESMTNDETNHFKRTDVYQAIQAYWNRRYATLPIESIEHFSGIRIDRDQTRKGRPQAEHLARARLLCDFSHPDGSWRNAAGAPTKRDLVRDYAEAHPEANHSQIARALGISRTTVVKWLRTS